jgi:23S rRNA (cytidine1920-2'-O)/16S rRNA (cytidine1409-2'-O)-methyltransferase
MIMAGEVRVSGEVATKAGMAVPVDADIEVTGALPYVSRGGYKLAEGLDTFDVEVTGKVCADVGACTGGFTDVLLQRGAARVYAIDVGYGQLAWKLRQDERVVVMERTNARHLESLAEPIQLAVIDVSFISLKLMLPAVKGWLRADGEVVMLIKPQFEAGRDQVGKGGIIREAAVHRNVVLDLLGWAGETGWTVLGLAPSPVTGSDGNVEFLARLGLAADSAAAWDGSVDDVIAAARALVDG